MYIDQIYHKALILFVYHKASIQTFNTSFFLPLNNLREFTKCTRKFKRLFCTEKSECFKDIYYICTNTNPIQIWYYDQLILKNPHNTNFQPLLRNNSIHQI